MKIFLIIALFAVLFYFLSKRLSLRKESFPSIVRTPYHHFSLVDTTTPLISGVMRSTLWTVLIGTIMFFLILIIGLKIKILWIALPLSLYLIGQLFVCTNHIRAIKEQQVYFNPENNEVIVDYIKNKIISFNLLNDIISVSEVKSVQKNRNTLFGYYILALKNEKIIIPYLVEQNKSPINKLFFDYLNNNYKIEIETRLFPIIHL